MHTKMKCLAWVLQAAFKTPGNSPSGDPLGTRFPKDSLNQPLDWDKVKAEDKTLVLQVKTHAQASISHTKHLLCAAEL